jgi:hypothetical protein
MAKKLDLDATLARLRVLRGAPDTDATLVELREILKNKSSHAVAKAAELSGELSLDALEPDLVAAFGRFMEKPEKTDKGCRAKSAIAEALHQLDHDEADIYLCGVRHVQMEPVWGGKADTAPRSAAHVRAVWCACNTAS